MTLAPHEVESLTEGKLLQLVMLEYSFTHKNEGLRKVFCDILSRDRKPKFSNALLGKVLSDKAPLETLGWLKIEHATKTNLYSQWKLIHETIIRSAK